MRRQALVALVVALVIGLASATAFAEGFELGKIEVEGNVSYGDLSITDWYTQWEDSYARYKALTPVVGITAGYEIVPGVKLLADYSLSIKSMSKPYGIDWNYGALDFENAWYTNLGLAASLKLTDNIDLVAGWTRFESGYTVPEGEEGADDVVNTGSGLRVGAVANLPLTEVLSFEASYALLPRVYGITFVNDEEFSDTYLGSGHELKAALTYVTRFGLGVTLGFHSELYSARDLDPGHTYEYEYDLASFSGGVLGISYSF